MKLMGICAAFVLFATSAHAQSDAPKVQTAEQTSIEFRSASGRLIGTVTRIGGATYYAAPDGTPLGVSSVVDGQRVYKSY